MRKLLQKPDERDYTPDSFKHTDLGHTNHGYRTGRLWLYHEDRVSRRQCHDRHLRGQDEDSVAGQ